MRIFVLSLALLVVAGCCFKRSTLTECDHYSGWCKEIRTMADQSWRYAQLSRNVYADTSKFDLGDQFFAITLAGSNSPDIVKDAIGFYAMAFRERATGDIVFVIRGTDNATDWTQGNILQNQNEFGLKKFRNLRMQYGESQKYVVAGHSLGGGVAMHISLHEKGVVAYSFNGSPNFRAGKDEIDNERYSIVEYGEILKLARMFPIEATQLYTSIGCSKGNAVHQHAQRLLADCLTQIAAIETPDAREALRRNDIELKWYRPEEARKH